MREIKYKLWDKIEKRMKRVVAIEWDLDYPDVIVSVATYPIAIYGKGGRRSLDAIILRQYIGLPDKNGKDIYSEDTIKAYMSQGGHEIFEIVWQQDKLRWGLKGAEDYPDSWAFTPANDFEVIGNKYEGVK